MPGFAHIGALEYDSAIIEHNARRQERNTRRKYGVGEDGMGSMARAAATSLTRLGNFAGGTGFNIHSVWFRSVCKTSDSGEILEMVFGR